MCHIFYEFLFDALVDIFGVCQSLQAFSELVELTNPKLYLSIDSVQLLGHVGQLALILFQLVLHIRKLVVLGLNC